MNKEQGVYARIKTNGIRNNQLLALSIEKKDVDRCTQVIQQYGLLTPPVVGNLSNGTSIVLSGECEILALRNMGIRDIDAITVAITEEDAPKLSLIISSLKKSPNAISEGMLVVELMKNGQYNQYLIGELLGKSKSWVSKRITLVTRLKESVRELVTKQQLCPHSAQEIARLPQDVQHKFSVQVIKEGLPKSVVENLVSAYNKQDCPEGLKTQILEQPCHAMDKITQMKVVKTSRDKKIPVPRVSCQSLQNNLTLLLRCIRDSQEQLPHMEPESLVGQRPLLKNCNISMQRFGILLETILENTKISPGKQESEEIDAN